VWNDIGRLAYLEPNAAPGTCGDSRAFFKIGIAETLAAGSNGSIFSAEVPTDEPELCTCLPETCDAVCEATEPTDTDGAQRCDACDNCPNVFNYDQTDTNGNGIGNTCEFALLVIKGGTGSGTVTDRELIVALTVKKATIAALQ
jgi:hypothetical protein